MPSFQQILAYPLIEVDNYHLKVANLLIVAVIWLLAWLLLRGLHRLINRGLAQMTWDQGRRYSLYLLTQYIVWMLATTAMFEALGVQVSVLLAGSTALLVGLGLGIQPIFRDVVSGIFLLFEGAIEVGDILEVGGRVAQVKHIHLRTSELVTREGVTLILPNHLFITENVVNWTHRSAEPSQFVLSVLVKNTADMQQVRTALQSAAREHPQVLDQPPPEVRLSSMQSEKGFEMQLRVWVAEKLDSESILSDLRFLVLQKLRQAGVKFPD
jgi:small-conductance mechanosensitive channel